MKISDIYNEILSRKFRFAWGRGVAQYALVLLHDLADNGEEEYTGSPYDHRTLLNGASCWQEYSEGGCALIFDRDIADRLCTPSELHRIDYGKCNPNSHGAQRSPQVWMPSVFSRELIKKKKHLI